MVSWTVYQHKVTQDKFETQVYSVFVTLTYHMLTYTSGIRTRPYNFYCFMINVMTMCAKNVKKLDTMFP